MLTGCSRVDMLSLERVAAEGQGLASPSLSVPVCKMDAQSGGGLVRKEGAMRTEAQHTARQHAERPPRCRMI